MYLIPGYGSHHQKRLGSGRDRLGQRGVRRITNLLLKTKHQERRMRPLEDTAALQDVDENK
jgi:hypothetical protein